MPPQERRRVDFHSHTYLTDGETSATDMWFEADRLGHRVLAITDHVMLNDPAQIIRQLRAEAEAYRDGPMRPIVGVEISMVPPRRIAEVATRARREGAEIVIVHGETLADPTPEGTNHAAVDCPEVDLLAHPGLLEPADAELARAHGIALELSARKGHSLGNGHVARVALAAGADLVVDSDAHAPEQLLSYEAAARIGRGAGLAPAQVRAALRDGPEHLIHRLAQRR